MKSTGIIRRVDELGRVVLPIELRNKFGITEKDPMEIYVDGSSIILKKYEPNFKIKSRIKCKNRGKYNTLCFIHLKNIDIFHFYLYFYL